MNPVSKLSLGGESTSTSDEQNYFQLGLKFFKENDLPQAVKYWEMALERDNNQSEIHSVLGNAYKMLNDFERSSELLHQAVSLEPNNFKYLYNYGLILYEQGKFDQALQVLNRARELEPDNAELLNDIGVMLYNLRSYNRAANVLQEAIEINPRYYFAKLNLGYVYLSTGNIEKARTLLNELLADKVSQVEVMEFQRQLEVLETNPNDIPSGSLRLEFSDRTFDIAPLSMLSEFDIDPAEKEIDLSIIVPIMDEVENLPILHEKITSALEPLRQNYEIIFIDDGSTDGSLPLMKKMAMEDEHIKVIQFRRNYGQTAALSAGFKYAHGKVIITLDGDLQNDPADIPKLLEKMAEGYDLVNGWRKDRKDKMITRKIPSQIANALINKLISGTGISLHDFGCTLKAYKRGIIKNIHLYGEMHRFIPVFAAWIGVRVTEIPVNHHARIHGRAKYNLSRVSRVIFDLLVVRFFSDYMTRPIQFFGKLARKIFTAGTVALAAIALAKIFLPIPISFDVLLLMFGILGISSFQIVIMGLLGEIMMRIYFEGQKKDYYIVEKIISKKLSS